MLIVLGAVVVDVQHRHRGPKIRIPGLRKVHPQRQTLLRLPLEPAAIERLSVITTSWMNYRTYGYSRQPIELFLQRGSLRDTVPPRGQLILAHISAGGEIVGQANESRILRSNVDNEGGFNAHRPVNSRQGGPAPNRRDLRHRNGGVPESGHYK